ncbi:MAG TPA: lipoxygenase family protein [Kamptonema sp.]|nr:lipoxygenase family protein [Kamptonema sp.]
MSVFPTKTPLKLLLKTLVTVYGLLKPQLPNSGDKYEYDDRVLAPLAMTSISEIKVAGIISTPLPLLPEDEIPTQKWLALVISSISILTIRKKQLEKHPTLINEFSSNQPKINLLDDLDLINEEIKAAKEQEDLKNAVFKLLSALALRDTDDELETTLPPENDIHLESHPIPKFKFVEQLNIIDRQIDQQLGNLLTKNPQELSGISLKADEFQNKVNIDKTYTALQKIVRYNVKSLEQELIDTQTDSREVLETTSVRNPTLEDYEQLINPLNIKPATLANFQQDKVFAYMQVAGPNPVMLNQIKKIDSRLPITSEQYQNILSEINCQDSLEVALQEGRVYLSDYSNLGNLLAGNFGGFQKYIYAPLALFAVPPDRYSDKNLVPIAICTQETPGYENQIFTPLDGDNWMSAKTVLQMADSNYHELISHLAQTHLFIEPFVLATNRCFTDKSHAIRVLLKAHLEGTVLINYAAHKSLLAPAGSIDSLLSATIGSDCQLAIKAAHSHLANFNQVAFPKTLEKRGVNNSKQLPIYPYRDDGQQIWDAIYQWVGEYLRIGYSSDESVKQDRQLQNWAGELLSKGRCNIGEDGDGRINTLDYLVEAISTVIFTASAQHAAVNFPQSGLMSYAPAFPLGCYSPAPTNSQKQQDFMELLPPLERADLQVQILYLLGSVYYTKLGDYSDSYFDDKVKIALDKFKAKLTEIEYKIIKEDSQRLVSYRYLSPSKIPQSINI